MVMIDAPQADAASGLVFDYWTADTDAVVMDDASASPALFTMPAQHVTLTAHYRQSAGTLSLSGGQIVLADGTKAAEQRIEPGQQVTIIASDIPDYQKFSGWAADAGQTLPEECRYAEEWTGETTFLMPEGDLTLHAMFTSDPSGRMIIEDGIYRIVPTGNTGLSLCLKDYNSYQFELRSSWNEDALFELEYIGSGCYKVYHIQSGYILGRAYDNATGLPCIRLSNDAGVASQQWYFELTGDGGCYMKTMESSSEYMACKNGQVSAGTIAVVSGGADRSSSWQLVPY